MRTRWFIETRDVAQAEIDWAKAPPLNAWVATTSLWYSRIGTSKRLKGAEDRMKGLADLVHSTGTVFAGSILAVTVWAALSGGSAGGVILAMVFLGLHGWSYWNSSSVATAVIDSILDEELADPTGGRGAD